MGYSPNQPSTHNPDVQDLRCFRVIDQIRCIATDEGLMREVLGQFKKTLESEIGELQRQEHQYERQLARDPAEIQRVATMPNPNDPTLSRLADLHDRTAKAEGEIQDQLPCELYCGARVPFPILSAETMEGLQIDLV